MSASDITDQYPQNGVAEVVPFDVLDLDGFLLEAVPAYNIRKIQCHPKENEWVGYLLTFGDTVLYDTSDTELIPEMNDIKADIIALPLGQKFTMDSVEDAAKAVVTVGASVAIPVHYGVFEGKEEDVAEFEKLLNGKAEVVRL
jgi:L-ascorbate metabolism protein UlaG (beta-lactamase superfamily)